MPLLAVLATAMATRAASDGFDWLSSIRFIALALVLTRYRRRHRALDWEFGWAGVALGSCRMPEPRNSREALYRPAARFGTSIIEASEGEAASNRAPAVRAVNTKARWVSRPKAAWYAASSMRFSLSQFNVSRVLRLPVSPNRWRSALSSSNCAIQPAKSTGLLLLAYRAAGPAQRRPSRRS